MKGRILVSGGGIAGLTLGILLKERGFDPLVIEREGALRTEGYMMDFFGTGWDVAERMNLVGDLRAVRYPIDAMHFIGRAGQTYLTVPIERVRRALDNKYVYLRRSDLERILFERARVAGVEVAFGRSISSLADRGSAVDVRFEDGEEAPFSLVFGADGVHSRVREFVFGAELRFERFLGGYVAAFHLAGHDYGVGRALKLYEETDRVVWLYPLDDRIPRIDATYVFRHPKVDVPREMRLAFVREQFEGAGWVTERLLCDYPHADPIFFDSLTQIVMPRWYKGRIALLGDACGSLTLLAGQGSHMAMAGAYVLANELEKHKGDHDFAFAAYESAFEDFVARKQKEAAGFAAYIMPTKKSRPWLRHFVMRLLFSPLGMGMAFRFLGGRSALSGYS